PNEVTNAPIAVVDKSKTPLSREIIQMLDATPELMVRTDALGYHEAQELMKKNEIVGIIYIPHQFETKIQRGEEALFTTYQTTTAFLYYLAIQKATSFVMLSVNDQIRPDQLVFLPAKDAPEMAQAQSPVAVVGQALYNYTEGYGTYLIPAVLMVIIFQTLMMVIAMISGEEKETNHILKYRYALNSKSGIVQVILSKTMTYCLLYALFSYFLLGLMPVIFDLPNIGKTMDIVHLLIPYLLASSFFGLAASVFYTDSDAPILMIAFFSVGLIFLSGVSYPLELMPWYWRAAHFIFPAAPGTLAFVKINSMGAGIPEVSVEYITLWIQCFVYFLLACWAYRYNIRKAADRNPLK
ncbi:MAG: ABC transporter permease, partial [Bacteroidales bacterium]